MNPEPGPARPDAPRVRLDLFDHATFDRGRPLWVVAAWMLVRWVFFDTGFPWPYPLKRAWLRAFGGRVGRGTLIRTRVYIHYPWKLDLGDHVWIGDGSRLMSFERITMEDHSAIAYDVLLAAAGHDLESVSFAARNAPIRLCSGSWIASRAVIGPGVTIGAESVVGAGSVVVRDVGPGVIVAGNPPRTLRRRTLERP